MYGNVIADRSTWKLPNKTVGGDIMVLLATQESRRLLRKGKTKYVYRRAGTDKIYYNQSKGGVFYSPMAMTILNMKKYADIFTNHNLTVNQKAWLERNDYELVK